VQPPAHQTTQRERHHAFHISALHETQDGWGEPYLTGGAKGGGWRVWKRTEVICRAAVAVETVASSPQIFLFRLTESKLLMRLKSRLSGSLFATELKFCQKPQRQGSAMVGCCVQWQTKTTTRRAVATCQQSACLCLHSSGAREGYTAMKPFSRQRHLGECACVCVACEDSFTRGIFAQGGV
jgi:hypothetical protein